MRTVTYKSVLDRIASYMGEANGLDVEDKALAEAKINFFVRLGWEHFFHPDTMTVEERTFRPEYDSGTTYAAPTLTAASEVYFPGDGNYYQALRSTTGNDPATGSGGDWTENSAYWAISSASYSADDYAAQDYVVGDQVRNPEDGRYYQCHTAHTGGASIDLTKFGVLTPFVRSLDYQQTGETVIGQVRFIWPKDPTVTNVGRYTEPALGFRLRQDYIQVLGSATVIWPEFQTLAPVFSGVVRSDTATYTSGTEVYDSATGDYWTANQSINVGESPTSTPAKWDKVVFPYYLAEFVAQSAYAMLTNKEQQQPENFTVQQAAGWPLLQAEIDKIERLQGQTRQLRVVRR